MESHPIPGVYVYLFDRPNLYAPTGWVQFTIVNWTHTTEANIIGINKHSMLKMVSHPIPGVYVRHPKKRCRPF